MLDETQNRYRYAVAQSICRWGAEHDVLITEELAASLVDRLEKLNLLECPTFIECSKDRDAQLGWFVPIDTVMASGGRSRADG